MSPKTRKRRRTRRVRRVKSSRKSHAKTPKRENTLGQYLSRISQLTNSKKRFSIQYQSLMKKGVSVTKLARAKNAGVEKIISILSEREEILGELSGDGESQKKKVPAENEKDLIGSINQKLDDEKEMLNNLGRELKKLRKSRISEINTQNRKKDDILKTIDKKIKKQLRLISAIRKHLQRLRRSKSRRKFAKELLIVELLDSKINKESILLKLVKEYLNKLREAPIKLEEDYVFRDETFVDEVLVIIKKQKIILGIPKKLASGAQSEEIILLLKENLGKEDLKKINKASGEDMAKNKFIVDLIKPYILQEAITLNLLKKEGASKGISVTKEHIKEKVFVNLFFNKITAEKKLVDSLKNQLENVRDEKIRRQIVKNIKEEVKELKSEEAPEISRDDLFKKYRIKQPDMGLVDTLIDAADMEEINV